MKSVIEAIVRPATELAASGWRGRCFLVILAELVEEDPGSLDADVSGGVFEPQVSDRTQHRGAAAQVPRLSRHPARQEVVDDGVRVNVRSHHRA